MYPILFEIFDYKIYSYGFSTIIACCLSTWLVIRKHPDYLELNDIVNFCLIALFSMLFADKLIYMIYDGFHFSLGELLQLGNQPMHTFYGTLWMALILIWLYCMIKNIPLWQTLDFLLYNAIPALAIQRIFGCFLAGCCYGYPTDLPWGVCFPAYSPAGMLYQNIPIHPTQLYYGVSALCLYFGLYAYQKKQSDQFDGRTFALGLMGLSLSYFLISFFRGDHCNVDSLLLFYYQLSSAVSFLLGLMIYNKQYLYGFVRLIFIFVAAVIITNSYFLLKETHATNLIIKKSPYSSVKWGDVLTLEISVKNPTDKQLSGNITLSFDGKVLIDPQLNKNIRIFPQETSYYNNKNILVSIKNQMIKKDFNKWEASTEKKIIVKCRPVQIGLLRIFARATFVSKKKQLNVPDYSTTRDQLGYPVQVSRIFVDESSNLFKNILLLTKNTHILDSVRLKRSFIQLLDDEDNVMILKYFGFIKPKHAKEKIKMLQHIIGKNQNIRQSPDLLENVRLLLEDPSNDQVWKFFGHNVLTKSPITKNTQLSAKESAEAFIMSIKGGYTLMQMIASEKDIKFVSSGSDNYISIRCQGRTYSFIRTTNIVYEMAKRLQQVKPGSNFNKIIAMTYKSIDNKKHIYISFLDLFEPIKRMPIPPNFNKVLKKWIFKGISDANQKYPYIKFNEIGHTIENTTENLNKLISITLNPHKSSDEKKEDLTNSLMIPNNIDAILSGALFVKQESVEVRLYLFVKTNDFIQKYMYFQYTDFFCGDSNKHIICKKVFEEISDMVEVLLGSL